jgi:DNA-binding response OmpR family regulator
MARILVVEDQQLFGCFLCDAIEQAGHEAHCVKTKGDAEAALRPRSYDLTVCDVRLPDGSGHELASRAADFGIKTMLITGDPIEAGALASAGVPHLRKPFRMKDFVEQVKASLQAGPSRQDPSSSS